MSDFQFTIPYQVLITVRYLTGPFPEIVCQLEYLVKNVPLQHAAIIINCILGIRYILTFHSKNPTAVQDDFWIVVINLWSAGQLGKIGLSKFDQIIKFLAQTFKTTLMDRKQLIQ